MPHGVLFERFLRFVLSVLWKFAKQNCDIYTIHATWLEIVKLCFYQTCHGSLKVLDFPGPGKIQAHLLFTVCELSVKKVKLV